MPHVYFVRDLVKEALIVGQVSIIVYVTLVPTTIASSGLVFDHGGKEHHAHLLYRGVIKKNMSYSFKLMGELHPIQPVWEG